MLKGEMKPDQEQHLQEWLKYEWDRCAQLRATFENQAITYLMTTNGGGAAAVIAFAGSAGYGNDLVFWTLGAFLVGLIAAGVAIAIGLSRMSWITRRLGEDHRSFNANAIRSGYLGASHHERFKKKWFGEVFGWISFAAFILGIILSIHSFKGYIAFKAEKALLDKAPPINQPGQPQPSASALQPVASTTTPESKVGSGQKQNKAP